MGVKTLDLGSPFHAISCDDEVENDSELLIFIPILFILEPKEFSLQNRFLKWQLTLGARKQRQHKLKPAASS